MRSEVLSVDITCKLDWEYFKAWTELTPEQQSVFNDNPTRCGGGGQLGTWCAECVYCEEYAEL